MTGPRRAVAILATALVVAACSRLDLPAAVVVDIGHTPAAPGAIAASGAVELAFNRHFARRLADHLDRAGLAATRIVTIDDADPRLDRRVAAIAAGRPCLVLSVHHDSVQERYVRYRTVGGTMLGYSEHAAGYSLFVPADNAPAAASLSAARAIADALTAAGERPSLHHAEPIEGENRRLLDPARGIYAGDFLKILRTAVAPTVLIEVGVIKHPAEEARLADPATADTLAGGIAAAVAALPVCPLRERSTDRRTG